MAKGTRSFVEGFINKLDSITPKNKVKLVVGRLVVRWIKLPRGFAKINVDAVISKNSTMASVAVVARDEDGNSWGDEDSSGAGGAQDPLLLLCPRSPPKPPLEVSAMEAMEALLV